MDVKTVATSVVITDKLKKDAIVDIDKIVERRLFSKLTDHILANKDKLPIDLTEEHKPWLEGTEHRLTLYLISKEELKRLKRIERMRVVGYRDKDDVLVLPKELDKDWE